MYQMNKLILNFPIWPLLSIVIDSILGFVVPSLSYEKTNDRDTSYFMILAVPEQISLWWVTETDRLARSLMTDNGSNCCKIWTEKNISLQ